MTSAPQPQPMSRKRSPGCELQLAADVVELLLLRDVERVVGAPEVGARIDAPPVEPQPEELVAHVVVVADRLAVENAGVPHPCAQPRRPRRARRPARPHSASVTRRIVARLAVDVELLLHVAAARACPCVGLSERGEHRRAFCTVTLTRGLPAARRRVVPFHSVHRHRHADFARGGCSKRRKQCVSSACMTILTARRLLRDSIARRPVRRDGSAQSR